MSINSTCIGSQILDLIKNVPVYNTNLNSKNCTFVLPDLSSKVLSTFIL
jgi:hypothetical protein